MSVRISKEAAKAMGFVVPAKKGIPKKATVVPDVVWQAYGLEVPAKEFRFHSARMWRFDWAWPFSKVALECDGGVFVAGGHNRGRDIIGDHEKCNEAVLLGWRLFRCTPAEIKSGAIFKILRQAMGLGEV